MKTLETVDRFVIPASVAEKTDIHLRAAGRDGAECFVLWTGVEDRGAFLVRTVHLPKQTAYKSSDGLCVRVLGEELHRLNLWLFKNCETLAVQVHSHPTEAYHSETDDTYPMVTLRGGLSLVVPDFGRDGVRGTGVASYRLGTSGWDRIALDKVERLIRYEG